MNVYSLTEIKILYEKIVRDEMRKQADFIEGIVCGMAGGLGGYGEVSGVIDQLRGEK